MYTLKYDNVSQFTSRFNFDVPNKVIRLSQLSNIFYIFAKHDTRIPRNTISIAQFYAKYNLNERTLVNIEDDTLIIASLVYLNAEPTSSFILTARNLVILQKNLEINNIRVIKSNIKQEHFKVNEKTIFKKQEICDETIYGFDKELLEITQHIKMYDYKSYLKEGDLRPIKVFNIFNEENSGKTSFIKKLAMKMMYNVEKFDKNLFSLSDCIFICTSGELKTPEAIQNICDFKSTQTNSVLFIVSLQKVNLKIVDFHFQLSLPDYETRNVFLTDTFDKLKLVVMDLNILNQSFGGKSFFEMKNIIRNALAGKLVGHNGSKEIQLEKLTLAPSVELNYTPSPTSLVLKIADFNLPSKIYSSLFSEIGGYEKAKSALIQSVIYPFKYKDLYKRLQIKQTKGILLFGPPGCCKTMLVRCLAFESNMPFFSIKGPELKRSLVGESEKAIRDLFDKARSSSPCIIFFDELDSISSKDRTLTGYKNSLLTALLVEMDGVDKLENVFIIGATNKKNIIDPALLRPNRFDKHIFIDLPNGEERKEIFKIYLGTKGNLDFEKFASDTEGFSGAEIECLINDSKQCMLEDIIKSGDQGNLEITNEMVNVQIRNMWERKKH
ncbi:Cell division cycle protein 48 like protein [Cucumispora dikerogammari]|nr:Cell division cycle protein 48 like protein [Cucumispora dikerogammari]